MRTLGSVVVVLLGAATLQAEDAQQILAATGVSGGLVAHVGCGDGRLTAALGAEDGYLVHGLDRDGGKVSEARAHIKSLGLYGKVSVDHWRGPGLPYADNLVNLLLIEDGSSVPPAERMRVLAPNGVAYVRNGDAWEKSVKPWPDTLDEWTHDLHDAGGNAVGSDRVVGPPHHMQWTAGPLWARSHGYTPSVSAMVSAQGRVYYICDETLNGVGDTVPSKWFLTARDAFNGVELWKRPVPNWGAENFSGTANTGKGVTTGRFTMPPQLGKRLVAVGGTVYVTLGATAPVTALDAATGEVIREYPETAYADEILCVGGRLIVTINPPVDVRTLAPGGDEAPAPPQGKHICAMEAETGRVLWRKGPFVGVRSSRGQDPFGRLELAADEARVLALTQDAIQALDAETGETAWKVERPALAEDAVRKLGFAGFFEYLLTTLVYHEGVVLLAQPEPNTHHTYHTMPGALYAYDAQDGRQLWRHDYGAWGHCTQPDVFVIDGEVWTHVHVETEFGSVWGNGFKALDSSKVDYQIQALDLRTGKVRRTITTRDIFDVGHHHRCYRNKTTERFMMSSRRGVEFVDLESGENYQNHWVRSGCKLGNLPCNGLLYVAPHPCQCYIDAKLTGFNALAAEVAQSAGGMDAANRLEHGPAYGKVESDSTAASADWPTYRGDVGRSGGTVSSVSTAWNANWTSRIGGKPSGVTVANGKLFVAAVDAHTVYALNAADGNLLWEFTAGARVDSPPTYHEGMALFGSADGRVYCLRAADGALVWRFNAAPQDRLVGAFGQLESAWPVHGSVMIHDGKCWLAAGRSSYLDGGIRLFALDPDSGEVRFEETLYSPDPETDKMRREPSPNEVEGVLNDILSTDGRNIYLRRTSIADGGENAQPRLCTTGGYLDSTWFNRTFWLSGPVQTTGLMVLGDDAAYGVEAYPEKNRDFVLTPAAQAYRLRSYSLKPERQEKNNFGQRVPVWEQPVGIRITAMVRAGDAVFVAGPPDIVDPADPHGAWEGRKGGVVASFAASDGAKLAEYQLSAPPVWDGMAAAGGRLYVALMDGTIVSLGES